MSGGSVEGAKRAIDVADVRIVRVCIHHERDHVARVPSPPHFHRELTDIHDRSLAEEDQAVLA